MDTSRDDREYEREQENEQTNRTERATDGKGQKTQDRKKKDNRNKQKLTPSLKWKTLGIEEEQQKYVLVCWSEKQCRTEAYPSKWVK